MRSAEMAASSGVRVMRPEAFSSSRREGGEKDSRQRRRNWPERLSTVRKSAAERIAARQSAGKGRNVVAAARRREARKKRRGTKLGLGIGGVGFFGGVRGGFFAGFRFGFFGGGFGLGGFGFFFGGFFVAFASVVGNVESTSFEEEAGAGADGAFDWALSPWFFWANGFGADGKGFVFHGLEDFEFVSALAAEIFVCWHDFLGVLYCEFGR